MLPKLSQVFVGLLLATTVTAGPSDQRKSSVVDRSTYINANSVLMFVFNTGLYAYDEGNVFGNSYGMYYPYTSIQNITNGTQISSPLYSAGLWLGGRVGSATRVTTADFAAEYWPGPMAGGSFIPGADTVQALRVYKLYADSLASQPNLDYTQWPVAMGAPLDHFGNPLLRGSQTLWSVYNDANPARHANISGSSSPLGIEVRQTTWASNDAGLERTIYMEYQLHNKGNDTIRELCIGLFYDPDIGWSEDDLTGCDTMGGFFYSYNANNSDPVYGSAPPALGIRLLYGPVVPSVGDSAWFFGRTVAGFRNLPLASYVSYPNGDDPQSAAESYNLLRGLKRSGTPLTNGTTFSYPGDPVTSTGNIDTLAGNPHGVGSVGPIDFFPGDSQSIVVKIVIGQGTDRLASIVDLRARMNSPDSIATEVPSSNPSHLPGAYSLAQNYPNPFNPSTSIEYAVPTRARVTLEVVNLLGQHITSLVDATQGPGRYKIEWQGTDDADRPVATGVYLYRIRIGESVAVKKMLLLK